MQKSGKKLQYKLFLMLFCILVYGFILTMESGHMKLKSPAFNNNEFIPAKYTCDGSNINPPLIIENAPQNTQSFVLIMDDPDAPKGTWDHWIVWNIVPNMVKITEDSIPGIQGLNSFKQKSYGGPCPPSGIHRYFFKIFALDSLLNLPEGSTKSEVEYAMNGKILEVSELIGLYEKKWQK